MNYGNSFPVATVNGMYPQTASYVQPQQMNYSQSSGGVTGVNWVCGDAGAKAWPVGPNTGAVLLDSEAPIMYIKYADAMGRPSLVKKRYEDYVEETPLVLPQSGSQGSRHNEVDLSEYVRKEDVEEMISREVEKRMSSGNNQYSRGRGGMNNDQSSL